MPFAVRRYVCMGKWDDVYSCYLHFLCIDTIFTSAKVVLFFDMSKKMFIFFHFSNKRYNSCKSA